jgi:hypothetical protein
MLHVEKMKSLVASALWVGFLGICQPALAQNTAAEITGIVTG